MTIFLSPGVQLSEVDTTQRVDGAATSVGAVVFESKKGPLSPTLITGGRNQFLSLYGYPDPTVSHGHDTALAFLRQSGALYCKRVTNGALYSGLIFYQDKEENPTRTLYSQFPAGLSDSYLSGNHKISLIRLEDKLVSGVTVSVDLSNGTDTETASVTYSTSSNATLDALATAVQTKLNIFGSGGLAKVVNETPGNPVKTQLRLKLSAALVSSNLIGGTVVVNGTETDIESVTYATSSAATVAALAAAIITAGAGNAYIEAGSSNLNIIVESPVGGVDTINLIDFDVKSGASQPTFTVETVKHGAGINDNRILTIIYPTTASVYVDSLDLSGEGAPDASVEENVELFEVFSENPGVWGNDTGAKITNIDLGVNQKLTLTLSGSLITGNSISGLIDGVAITPVTYATSSDATLAALAARIQAYLVEEYGSGSASVVSIANSTSNDRVIEVIAPNSVTTLVLSEFVISGGASQATITVAEVLKNIPTTNTFDLEIYSRDNVLTPLEKFTVSLGLQTDGFGIQQNIAEAVNRSANKSATVRIAQQTPVLANTAVMQATPAVIFMAGGSDGSIVTSSQVRQGWSDFEDKENYDIRILLNAGYYDPSVQQTMTSLAETRQDCIAILDAPSSQQTTQNIANYRKNSLNINSSFGAFYNPDLLIIDEFSGTQRFVPPSGYVGAQYAYTDNVAETWFSPAGLNRGNIDNVIGLRTLYKKNDLDITYPLQVNSIIQKSGIGFVIWGDKTLQAKSSALSFVSVRRLLCIIGVSITKALDFSVFEPNDDFTRNQITQLITSFLRPIQDKRGLQNFEVVADSRNNKSADIDAGILNVDVYLTPTVPTQNIGVRLIITKSGVTAADLTQ